MHPHSGQMRLVSGMIEWQVGQVVVPNGGPKELSLNGSSRTWLSKVNLGGWEITGGWDVNNVPHFMQKRSVGLIGDWHWGQQVSDVTL